MSVEVKNLVKEYGSQKAVGGISFSIQKGEVVGFLGPNGAGKSTTMKIITGYLAPTEGQVMVCDKQVFTDSMATRMHVGYLPESNPFYPEMYVKEYLSFVAKVHKIQDAKSSIKELIEQTGLGNEQHKQIGQLSKGFKQRVGLAQAMIHKPDVLILDEPTSGLDPNQVQDIRKLIRDLGKEKTVILSSHIMQEVQAVCDRVIIINKGVLVADDSTESLKGRANGSTIVYVEFNKQAFVSKLQALSGVSKVEKIDERTMRVYSSEDLRERLFDYAIDNDLKILSMQKEQQDLESVFRSLTQN